MVAHSRYIANVVVLSEALTICQSILFVFGSNLSYLNLIFFFSLSFPVLFFKRMRSREVIYALLLLILIALKILIQGVGDYFVKSIILLMTIPFYAFITKNVSFDDIQQACSRYRYLVLMLGVTYMVCWYFFGTYRNASTLMITIIMFLGFYGKINIILAGIFATATKTQFKIWIIVSMLATVFSVQSLRRSMLVLAGLSAAVFPIVLLYIDTNLFWFNASQLSSLGERLNEVQAFMSVYDNNTLGYLFHGWPIGQPLDAETLSKRGYMHSSYLWLTGTLGLPITLLLFFKVVTKSFVTRRCFLIKLFLILANSFTFLILTNPFGTILLLCSEHAKAR